MITAMRPYAEKLTELLQNLSATLKEMWEDTTQQRGKKVLVVAIITECGAFNSNVIKASKAVLCFMQENK
jgi:F-type H+-transporting ATPase subunit gamma